MRILVFGGRIGVTKQIVFDKLDKLSRDWVKETVIIHGKSPGGGVDRYADDWAKSRGYSVDPCPIDNALDGFRDNAPKNRNSRMIAEKSPDLAISFSGGPGTRDMWQKLWHAHVRIYDVELDG